MKYLLVAGFIFSFLFSKAQKQLVIQGTNTERYITHTIAQNETFLRLGSLYNVSPNRIAAFNKLSLSHNLVADSTVKVPLSTFNFDQKGQKGNYEELVPLFHPVKDGETFEAISTQYNKIPVDTLKSWNNTQAATLSAGTNVVVGYLKVKSSLASYFINKENKTATVPTVEKTKEPVPAPTEKLVTTSTENYDKYDTDELLQLARKTALDTKNYPLAITILKTAIARSPDYSDLRIFLGRIYTWTDKLDSARAQFDYILQHDPSSIDAYVAYSDLEYWNDRPEVSLGIVDKGLTQNEDSRELLLRKIKILNSLKRSKEAEPFLKRLVKNYPDDIDVRALAARMRDERVGDRIGISYDYTYFDQQFSDPWHIVSFDYSRLTGIGSVAARVNYANRFKSNGVQYEVDAYPDISKNLYSYVSFGYSDDVGVFPKYRAGFSLYASLPKSYEGEVGFRYLKFTDATWIYTAAFGKYYKSWLFTGRTYLTPGPANISHSYNLGARYYFGGMFDFIGLAIGRGISPDERANATLLNSNYKLQTSRASATYKHEIRNKHIITLTAGWINTEYLPKTKGNQIEGGVAYQLRL